MTIKKSIYLGVELLFVVLTIYYGSYFKDALQSTESVVDTVIIYSVLAIVVIMFIDVIYTIYKYVYDTYVYSNNYNILLIEIAYDSKDTEEVLNKYDLIHKHALEVLPSNCSVEISIDFKTKENKTKENESDKQSRK